MSEAQTTAAMTRAAAIDVLLDEAKRCARMGGERQEFIDDAPQWALDAVTQRQLDAIVEMAWRGLP